MKKKVIVVGVLALCVAAGLYLYGELFSVKGNHPDSGVLAERVEEATVLIHKGDLDQALALLEENVESIKYHERSFHLLSMLYLQRQDYDSAFRYAKPLVETTHDPKILTEIGSLFAINNYEKMAQVCFTKAIQKNERSIPAYIELGKLYGNQEKFLQAIGVWQDGLRFEPQNEQLQALIKQGYALWESETP